MFRRILVANRGEIASRIVRAVHAVGAKAICVYSDADAHMPYLKEADEAYWLGKSPASESYLNQDRLLALAQQHACEAIHPGYGFLAENARFAQRCEQQKLSFIGPKPVHMRLMGDKATARRTMGSMGLLVLPGSKDVLQDVQSALMRAQEVGYPVLLKASAGGGGKGMRLVDNKKSLADAFALASLEAEKAFGDPALYLEKYLVGARHIEFQVLGDVYGHVIHLGERECSIQRKHQKLLEEAPAVGLSSEKRSEIGALVVKAMKAIGYVGAGTVEFLMDAKGDLYFMEMNTRIQVEHTVTEMLTGVDLLAWQIRIAANEPLTITQDEVRLQGHAIECRINAEDPDNGFQPSPGEIRCFKPPKHAFAGPVRLETFMGETGRVVPFYDSMIAKLIVHGKSREEAIKKLVVALKQFEIEGIAHTLPLHLQIVQSPLFQQGAYNCQFLDEAGLI